MIWKQKEYSQPKRYNYGDRLTKPRFAILPVVIDGHWLWWEKYLHVKTWTKNAYSTEGSMGIYYHDGWVNTREFITTKP